MALLKLAIRLDETIPGHQQKKEHCPGCNKPKKFVRFYDFTKEEYLPSHFGRCDRQEHCGYYNSPYSDTEYKPDQNQKFEQQQLPENPITYVDIKTVAQTLSKYETNTFVQFLISKVGNKKAMETVFKLYIGTAKNNGTIFWQIDQFNKPRTGAKIHYLPDGHRDKQTQVTRLFQTKDGYKPCLFGEHQIFSAPKNALFAIVESEKSAAIADCYMNTLKNRPIIWLACSGSNGLTYDKIQCLKGKDVVLVPDFSFHARATWGLLPMRKKLMPSKDGGLVLTINEEGDIYDYESAKDRFVSIGCSVQFFDPYPEVKDGSDLADYLVEEDLPEEPDPEDNEVTEDTEDKSSAIKMPDFSQLKINIDQSNLKPRSFEESVSIESLIKGRQGIKFTLGDEYKVRCSMTNLLFESKMNEYLTANPLLSKLIHKFDLQEGSISLLE